jgi:hypothetical protein
MLGVENEVDRRVSGGQVMGEKLKTWIREGESLSSGIRSPCAERLRCSFGLFCHVKQRLTLHG